MFLLTTKPESFVLNRFIGDSRLLYGSISFFNLPLERQSLTDLSISITLKDLDLIIIRIMISAEISDRLSVTDTYN